MNHKPKMIHELYTEFCEKFTTGEISVDTSKQVLFQYLAEQMKRNNGKFIHIPSDYLCSLIKRHLGHQMEDRMYQKQV